MAIFLRLTKSGDTGSLHTKRDFFEKEWFFILKEIGFAKKIASIMHQAYNSNKDTA